MRPLAWLLILLGIVLLWPLAGPVLAAIAGLIVLLALAIGAVVVVPLVAGLLVLVVPLLVALALGLALVKVLFPLLLLALGVWLLFGRGKGAD